MKNFKSKVFNYLEETYLIKPNTEQLNALNIISKQFLDLYSKINIIKSLFFKPSGIYIHGPVGVGKSVLMEAISKVLKKKLSMFHFNDFITSLQQTKSLKNKTTIINKVIKDKVVIIDELQINNLADAILIFNFLTESKKKKIFIVFTSNRSPKNLYRSIINKRFVSSLKSYLNSNFLVIEFKSTTDYRLINEMGDFFFFSNPRDNCKQQDALVKKICITKLTPNKVLKNSHLTFKSNNSKRIIDSSFKKICGANFGVMEYKQIVKKFNFIIIRNIPVLNEEKKDLIARFITLIDHIYDEKKFLSISSNYGIDKIFKANTKKFEYKRTYSRLIEMGSKVYISKFFQNL